MVGLTGIVIAVAVLIIQMATGTLSPRYMRIWYRDPLQKAVFAGFLGTLGFAYALLRRTGDGAPHLGVTLVGLAAGITLIVLLIYFDRFAHLLRPVALCAYVANAGLKAEAKFWEGLQLSRLRKAEPSDWPQLDQATGTRETHGVTSPQPGVVQGIDYEGLLSLAADIDSLVVVRANIGDFVPDGGTLAEVTGAPSPIPEDRVRDAFQLGIERAFNQDPAFALRIIVDVAIRALSPAINDPTTAVQSLDYVERILRRRVAVDLASSYALSDATGQPRVLFRLRTWEDFLALGVTEIRECGSTSTQTTRRLRALLEGLLQSAHASNRDAIESQLRQLDSALEEDVSDPLRRNYASIADKQGIGGTR
jgi:uncharacterized membrane protein